MRKRDCIAIAGFHTLCVDVGEISGHCLSGYRAGDPLPSSFWNLHHRAKCGNNAGMVYDQRCDLWVDIYLYSASDKEIIHLSLEEYEEIATKIGKRLPNSKEFDSLAAGSNEYTNIRGSKYHSISGGHIDTRGRRMISGIGCEDCAGLGWQWLKSNGPFDKNTGLLAGGCWDGGSSCGSRDRYANYSRWSPNLGVGARFVSAPLVPRSKDV